jgi:hypothetical protein
LAAAANCDDHPPYDLTAAPFELDVRDVAGALVQRLATGNGPLGPHAAADGQSSAGGGARCRQWRIVRQLHRRRRLRAS